MGIFDTHYLNEKHISGFDNYKYNAIDTSPLSNYLSHPFWNQVVKLYPLWVAPNVLTLAGFLSVMLGFFIVSYMDYDIDVNSYFASPDAIPNWIWFLVAVLTFAGHTLDGTDGKQARRTGASGPVGELFDHGLDSWSTVPFTITIFSIFGRGEFSVSLLRLLCILISVQVVFIVTHWEKYNTGVLYLSWGYDASQFGLVGFYLLTYFVGYEFFKFYVFKSVSFAVCFETGFYVVCVLSLIMSTYNMYISYCIDKTGRQENLYEACLPMFSSMVLFAVSVYWAWHSKGNIIERDPRFYFWTMGTVFSNIACRLIIAQMTHTRAEPFNFLLCLYCTAAFVSLYGNLSVLTELTLLRMLAVGVTLAHIHYGICLVRQLCDHFHMDAFSLDYLQKTKQREKKLLCVYDLPQLPTRKGSQEEILPRD